jgi:hypothetical protein
MGMLCMSVCIFVNKSALCVCVCVCVLLQEEVTNVKRCSDLCVVCDSRLCHACLVNIAGGLANALLQC